jgi:hypothetical protein
MNTGPEKHEKRAEQVRKRGPIKPDGYIEDPEERARLADELRGSCPNIISQEELQRRRWES